MQSDGGMSRKEKIISISAIAFLLAALTALVIVLSSLKPHTPEPQVKSTELVSESFGPDFDGFFNTVCILNEYRGCSEDEFDKMCRAVTEELEKYHKLSDRYNNYEGINNIKTINEAAKTGASVKVSEELMALLEFSVEMHGLTDGALNIAMGAVLDIWHEYREDANKNFDDTDNRLPTEEELGAAAEHCDITKLELDREGMTVRLLDPGMSLDLGAVAKGYAVERAAERLTALGADGYAINAGGNIRLIGSRIGDMSWEVGVRDPYDPLSNIETLSIKNTSAVTSGGYERYYSVNGKKYHHIINDKTLMPASFHASVTVVHPDSGVADCLSTALFNSDAERCEKILKNIEAAGYETPRVVYVPCR